MDQILDDLDLPRGTTRADLQKLMDEVTSFRGSSVHDSYHNAYNAMVERTIQRFFADFKRGVPVEDILPKFNKFVEGLRRGLEEGKITL